MDFTNLALLTDLYQLTMMQGYYEAGMHDTRVVFDLFYRRNPHGNGYVVACGLEQAIEYVKNMSFSDEDIGYIQTLGTFRAEFIEYLKTFSFNGSIYGVPEGSVVFPHEPILRVEASIIEAQLLETALLNIVNHQSLVATKAARVAWAAGGDPVLEFGLRRAQGPDAGVYGARAAIIAGCVATSNMLAGKLFDVPVRGTHAHSWVMSFPDELSAFRKYCEVFPDNAILLVDTYNTLKSGVPNAIKAFQEMREGGVQLKNYGIRLDSGDFAYLPKKARLMLDEAGFTDAVISASGDLDEYLIADLKNQGTKITLWGVGTSLITSDGCSALGGVYKLAAEQSDGRMVPKMKISENIEKMTNPGIKKIVRLYEKRTGKTKADLIAFEDEIFNPNDDLTIFHPIQTWKQMTLIGGEYDIKELLVPIFVDGECVYKSPHVMEIRDYFATELGTMWDELKRLQKPHLHPVDLSQKLFDLKKDMINTFNISNRC